jgi:hypothetical protein
MNNFRVIATCIDGSGAPPRSHGTAMPSVRVMPNCNDPRSTAQRLEHWGNYLCTAAKNQQEHRGVGMNYRAEATPHGVNIMTRNDAGMYEHVALITYESAVARLDAGEYDDKPDKDTPYILPLLMAGRVAGSTSPRSITSLCGAG